MEGINWDMVKAMTGVLSLVMTVIGGIIVLATRWIFVTKKEYISGVNSIDKKLYKDGTSIFVLRSEYEIEITDIRQEIKDIEVDLIRRPEWKESKTLRERRTDETQRLVCNKIDDVNLSIDKMREEINNTNKTLNNLVGRFETYLEIREGNGK